MQQLSYARLPKVSTVVGAVTPVPAYDDDGTNASAMAWSVPSNCVIVWNGAQWVGQTNSPFTGTTGISTTSSGVTTVSA